MSLRIIPKIIMGLIFIFLSYPRAVWAHISEILTSHSEIFRLQSTKKIKLIPELDITTNDRLQLVQIDGKKLFLLNNTEASYPFLSISSGYPLNIPNRNFAVKGSAKIMRTKIYYKVRRGDNLSKIAKKYRTSEKNLLRLNNRKSDFLREGEKLIVGIREKVIEIPYIDENLIRKEVATLKENLTLAEESPQESSQIIGQKIVDIALRYLGLPYKYGGESLWGIDCSAFVKRVWGFFGLDLPRTSREQYTFGEKMPYAQLQPGDLVFFHRRGRQSISHVGIYIGDKKFVHASGSDRKVSIGDLTQKYYRQYYKGACRVINFLFPELSTQAQ